MSIRFVSLSAPAFLVAMLARSGAGVFALLIPMLIAPLPFKASRFVLFSSRASATERASAPSRQVSR